MTTVAILVALLAAVDAMSIPRVQLGSSSLKVSEVCLGTMTWGKQNTMEEGVEQLNLAFDEYGLNFLDTAEMYPVPTEASTQGATDLTIAKWLKSRKNRAEVVLASKVCGASDRIDWVRKDKRKPRVTKADIVESVDMSLERLGTDYIDLLQIHWPDRYVPLFGGDSYDASKERDSIPFKEQLEGLKAVVDAGKVRYVGVSNETPYGVCQFVQAAEQYDLPRIHTIQNSYSLIVRSDFENGLAETCSKRHCDVSLLAYSPLAGGILSGKYERRSTGDEDLEDGAVANARLNLFPGFMDRYLQSKARAAVAEYVDIAHRYDLTPSQLALKWCYTRPHVASTIIGATSVEQLKENIEAFHVELPEAALDDIGDVYRRYRDPSKTS